MTRKRLRLFVLVLGTIVAAILLGALWFWQFRLKPYMIFDETLYGNMSEIAAVIGDFAVDKKRLPAGLKEVVQGGYLPERSPLYRCPLLHGSLRKEAIPYTDCEFDIRFDPNQVVISMPLRAVERGRLEGAPARFRERRVDKSGHLVSP